MIKIDIVKRVADRLKLKDKEALAVVDTIIEALKESIKEYGRVEIRNFGVFQIKQRKPRTGRNPRNKREYPIHPRRVVTFKLGKELKEFAMPKGGQARAAAAKAPVAPPSPPRPATAPGDKPSDVSQPSLFSNKDGE